MQGDLAIKLSGERTTCCTSKCMVQCEIDIELLKKLLEVTEIEKSDDDTTMKTVDRPFYLKGIGHNEKRKGPNTIWDVYDSSESSPCSAIHACPGCGSM